eukprot:TRINITY_DN7973_c0_g1_i20.p1 TRINITY_DN7973_c0_g1~~TRINITY_DN7973_c0_g1_i20.p1  ORF type:complete len:587 (+),score=99.97 TRINITY_DN7973_c0_g1_i20:122-1882(+)
MCIRDRYDYTAAPLVDDVLNGINAAVICYGQTGSGKTYTMLGPDMDKPSRMSVGRLVANAEHIGMIPRVCMDVLRGCSNLPGHMEWDIRVSYVEIYLERVQDLLAPPGSKGELNIRQDADNGLYVLNATEVPVRTIEEILELIVTGSRNRVTAETLSNPVSSRSHAILLMTVRTHDTELAQSTLAQLYMVDLAGSEKQSKTGSTGTRLAEAGSINTSLLTLGNCIFALGTGARHVPYRESKLTRLLQNSFGGNSKTSIIINCSPSDYNERETLSTLRFGDRTKRVTNRAVANVYRSREELEAMVRVHETVIEQQRLRIAMLESQLGGQGNVNDSIMQPAEAMCEFGHRIVGRVDGQDCCEYGHFVHESRRPTEDRKKPVKILSGADGFRQLLRCPITRNPLKDPVVACDGHTYERFAFTTWMRSHGLISPISLQSLSSSVLFPNHTLRSLLDFVPQTESTAASATEILEHHTIEIILSQDVISGALLAACSLISTAWADIAQEEHLWVRVLNAEFDVSVSCAAREGKMSYRQCYAKAASSRSVNSRAAWVASDGAVKLHSNKPGSPKKGYGNDRTAIRPNAGSATE